MCVSCMCVCYVYLFVLQVHRASFGPDATILRASAHSAMQLQHDLREFFAEAARRVFCEIRSMISEL
jgi:hypothetical protein